MTFDIDANGIVSVSARDKGTGREQKITITGTGNLSKDEIARMQRDAELHAEEDKAQRERAESRNKAESLLYQTEKQLKDLGDKADAELKTQVESGISNLRTALNANDTKPEELNRLTEELQQVHVQDVGTAVSAGDRSPKARQNGHSPDGDYTNAQPQADAHDDTVVDTEFK